MLQIALNLPFKSLYVSGEESQRQLKMRASRLDLEGEHCLILTETNTQKIFHQISITDPGLLIIDSIQTLHSDYIDAPAGSISQYACSPSAGTDVV